MFELTRIFFIVFGLLTIAGGVIGFVKAKSRASLIAGAVSGLLLLAAAMLMRSQPLAGEIMGLVVSLLLAGRFVPAFLKTRAPMPAGMMSVLSVIGVVLTLLLLVGVR